MSGQPALVCAGLLLAELRQRGLTEELRFASEELSLVPEEPGCVMLRWAERGVQCRINERQCISIVNWRLPGSARSLVRRSFCGAGAVGAAATVLVDALAHDSVVIVLDRKYYPWEK